MPSFGALFGPKANCLQRESSMRVVTSDLREAIAAVSRVYCPHDVKVLESNRGIDAVLEAIPGSRRQMVSLRYSAPVKIDAGQFENLLLFMTCVVGSAIARQTPIEGSKRVRSTRYWMRSSAPRYGKPGALPVETLTGVLEAQPYRSRSFLTLRRRAKCARA
jgi:hypothetical protein